MKPTTCFAPAHILLPSEQVPLEQWGCIACDQFTSDRSYWQRAEETAAGAPSTLNLILPEVYLEDGDADARVKKIHATMQDYAKNVLTRAVDGFIYVERTEQSGRVRQGLVGRVDLEAYSYRRGEKCTVRPSECTVESRIPPRMKVRTGAALETPHIMMLADDPDCTLIEPIAAHKDSLPKVYEGELMLGGGHVKGWRLTDSQMIRMANTLSALKSPEAMADKYGMADAAPLLFAVGDGNHSLATAKACYENLKKVTPPEQWASLPARYALVEVVNLHDDALTFEPIHRVLFNVDCATVLLSLITWSDSNMAGCCFGGSKKQPFTLAGPHMANVLSFEDPTEPLTVGTIDDFISDYIERHPEAKVDYVHDEPAVRALCKQGAVAFLMPPFAKSDLFRGVVMGGVLPRKTFSMGHAEEKRYYIECRKITE